MTLDDGGSVVLRIGHDGRPYLSIVETDSDWTCIPLTTNNISALRNVIDQGQEYNDHKTTSNERENR